MEEIRDLYDELKETTLPIILYGTGNGGDKILNVLHQKGISAAGVAANDAFVRGQSFRGFPVRRIFDWEAEKGRLLLLIAFGSGRPEVLGRFFELSRRHRVLCPDVPVYGEGVWDKAYFRQHQKEIETVPPLLGDEASRFVYQKIIDYKLTGSLQALQSCYSSKEEVFSRLLPMGAQEEYADLGAYRGDTVQEFCLAAAGHYRGITALEPDPKTFAKLKESWGHQPGVTLYRMGIWERDGDLSFVTRRGRGTSAEKNGNETVPVTCLDTLYARRPVSYIKMDVEGCEKEALRGGKAVLRRDRPHLNIALYHRSEDLFAIPLLLQELLPGCRMFLRQHPHVPAWDLNLYVPGERSRQDRSI